MAKDSIVDVISTRQRTSGSKSKLFVTSKLLTTVSRILSTSTLWRDEAHRLQLFDDVILRLGIPCTFFLHGQQIGILGRFVGHGQGRFNEHLAQFLLLPVVAGVISPQASLRLVGVRLGHAR